MFPDRPGSVVHCALHRRPGAVCLNGTGTWSLPPQCARFCSPSGSSSNRDLKTSPSCCLAAPVNPCCGRASLRGSRGGLDRGREPLRARRNPSSSWKGGRTAGVGLPLDLRLTTRFWTTAFIQPHAFGLSLRGIPADLPGVRERCVFRAKLRPRSLTRHAGPRIMRTCAGPWCARRIRSAAAPVRDDLGARRRLPAPQSGKSGFPDRREVVVVLGG